MNPCPCTSANWYPRNSSRISSQQEAKQEREALLDILPTEENLHKNSLDSQNPYERKIEKLDLKNTEELKQILIKQYKEEERF